MLETMLLELPGVLLGGLLCGLLVRSVVWRSLLELLPIPAYVLATLMMPVWMLPVMMDRAEAFGTYHLLRDTSLAATGFLSAMTFAAWPVLWRHLLAIEQIAMVLRFAVWYGMAPQALCTAWDRGAQTTTGIGLAVLTMVLAILYSVMLGRPERRHRPTHWANSTLQSENVVDR